MEHVQKETTPELVFRPASEHDYPAIAALVKSPQELFRVYPRGSYPFTVAQLRTLAAARRELTVVTLDDTVAGFANLYDLTPATSAFIGNVIVDSSVRGQGIGRALIRHMLGIVFDQYNLPEVRISVFGNNVPALLLYASLGFRPYAIEERRDPDGMRTALLHMTLARSQRW